MHRLKFLTDRIHGVLDYAVVLIFAAAPTALGLSGAAVAQCYLTAGVQLLMTLCTDMPLGVVKLMPLKVHGTIELIVGLALIAMAWTVHGLESGQLFFTVMGAVIFFIWVSSNYGDPKIQDA